MGHVAGAEDDRAQRDEGEQDGEGARPKADGDDVEEEDGEPRLREEGGEGADETADAGRGADADVVGHARRLTFAPALREAAEDVVRKGLHPHP